jgi:hypothetical protein
LRGARSSFITIAPESGPVLMTRPPTWIGGPRCPFPRMTLAEYVTASVWFVPTGIGVFRRMTLKTVSLNVYMFFSSSYCWSDPGFWMSKLPRTTAVSWVVRSGRLKA